MRLSRLLVIEAPAEDDWPLMAEVVTEAWEDPMPGLPRHMRESLQSAAGLFLAYRRLADYVFVCLIATQARPGGEPREVIELRIELERMFFTILVGDR